MENDNVLEKILYSEAQQLGTINDSEAQQLGTINDSRREKKKLKKIFQQPVVADPEPNPHRRVFGPPGSGSISQRYGSGSGSDY